MNFTRQSLNPETVDLAQVPRWVYLFAEMMSVLTYLRFHRDKRQKLKNFQGIFWSFSEFICRRDHPYPLFYASGFLSLTVLDN